MEVMEPFEKKIFPFAHSRDTLPVFYDRWNSRHQFLYIFCLACLSIGLASLPFIYVPVNRTSPGFIDTQQQTLDISSPLAGKVQISQIGEDREVQRGELLLALESTRVEDKIQHQTRRARQLEKWMQDLDLLTQSNPAPNKLESIRYRNAWLTYEKQQQELSIQRDQAQRKLQRSLTLHESGAIATTELEEAQYNFDLIKSRIELAHEQHQKTWKLEAIEHQASLSELRASIRELEAELARYTIRAPRAGFLTQTVALSPGNYVYPGQVLGKIAGKDSLQVVCFVGAGDIGLLHPQMPVRFQVDSYAYQHWGLATGKIHSIARDVVLEGGKPCFRVICTLDQAALHLKNGFAGELKKGMSLTVRFRISQRSLFQLLWDRVDDWLNPNIPHLQTDPSWQ
jgi:HlyD family secretion protein